MNCQTCGAELTGRNPKYCDRSCMALGLMKEDVGYGALKVRARKASPPASACESCGAIENLQRHHKDQDPRNNDPGNLQTLCGSCHLKLHWRELGKQGRPKVSHCKYGHPYDEANTYIWRNRQHCRTCAREKRAERKSLNNGTQPFRP
jgi:hypothetical protein